MGIADVRVIPSPDVLERLEPEEGASYVLEFLNSIESPSQDDQYMNLNNLASLYSNHWSSTHDPKMAMRLVTEAWMWLEKENLIAPDPRGTGFVFLTRRGRRLKRRADVQTFQKANLLPKGLLHPIIAQEVMADFLRGKYDAAVFKAFKEVEVEVRKAGGFAPTDLGTDLMRKAFHPQTGPLTKAADPVAERQALSDLFAGAVGSYKNPSSHRHVQIDAEETVEMIMLASHLLRIVDSRRP